MRAVNHRPVNTERLKRPCPKCSTSPEKAWKQNSRGNWLCKVCQAAAVRRYQEKRGKAAEAAKQAAYRAKNPNLHHRYVVKCVCGKPLTKTRRATAPGARLYCSDRCKDAVVWEFAEALAKAGITPEALRENIRQAEEREREGVKAYRSPRVKPKMGGEV